MSEGNCYQICVELVRNEPLANEQLEDIAEAVLDALNRKTRLVALGPVVSVDFARTALEVEFTAAGDTVEDVNEKVERVTAVVREALAEHDASDGFQYNASRTDRLVSA